MGELEGDLLGVESSEARCAPWTTFLRAGVEQALGCHGLEIREGVLFR